MRDVPVLGKKKLSLINQYLRSNLGYLFIAEVIYNNII